MAKVAGSSPAPLAIDPDQQARAGTSSGEARQFDSDDPASMHRPATYVSSRIEASYFNGRWRSGRFDSAPAPFNPSDMRSTTLYELQWSISTTYAQWPWYVTAMAVVHDPITSDLIEEEHS